ncbi:glycosyltransferase [Winogradskyella rapida]|uniref:Glycosyltransferase n=1 Tax=Winogradskyella rapida TaxID=549701 RepID=A0ABW3KVV2_9FLAO
MKKIRVNYIFRKRGEGHNSIEELFHSIISCLPEHIDPHVVELPYSGASLKAVVLNIWHVLFLKGVIHVTGDVYYIGLIPFKKTIITVHDVKFIKGSPIKKYLLNLLWLVLPGLISKKISIISRFSKEEYLKIVPSASKKVEVIYNPVNPLLKKCLKTVSQTPIILHLGTKENKNLENTIKALVGIKCKLFIVGKLSKHQLYMLKLNNVKYENFLNIDFVEIKSLYELCDIVSFASYYEGFGMPIIEANKVGRVLITSKRAAIPEIAVNAVHYVDPNDVDDMRNGFIKVINDDTYRNKLINLGLENVKRFEIEAVVSAYAKMYQFN